MNPNSSSLHLPVRDYDLAATLNCGQAFRWRSLSVNVAQASRLRVHRASPPGVHPSTDATSPAWSGVIGSHWVRLSLAADGLLAETADPINDWQWLTHYLQIETDLARVLATFPDDEPLRAAVGSCRGLRLLRQEPWECLASFILSSTKQIVQIQQIITLLSERHGDALAVLPGHPPAHSFPGPDRIASLSEAELRACKMGFRAPYLLATARAIAEGRFDLERIRSLPTAAARAELISLPGVGRKIADCVLLFAYGFPDAFPVDVWVMKALRQLYFPRRRPSPKRLLRFTETYFGAHAGYAQQYLFHYMRTRRPPANHEPALR